MVILWYVDSFIWFYITYIDARGLSEKKSLIHPLYVYYLHLYSMIFLKPTLVFGVKNQDSFYIIS